MCVCVYVCVCMHVFVCVCDMTQYLVNPLCVAALPVADAGVSMCVCCVRTPARVRVFACTHVNVIEYVRERERVCVVRHDTAHFVSCVCGCTVCG